MQYTRAQFMELSVQIHTACCIDVIEVACFQEPHEDGSPHHNVLVRAAAQYKWLPVAKRFLADHRVHVNFAPHIRSWSEGVVYGRVASEHKSQDRLDQAACS